MCLERSKGALSGESFSARIRWRTVPGVYLSVTIEEETYVMTVLFLKMHI